MVETHYLHLAYLFEVAIVVNLAFLELKRKIEFNTLEKEESTNGIPNVLGKICKERGCLVCSKDSYLLNKFKKFDNMYIEDMYLELCMIQDINQKKDHHTLLKDAWSFSERSVYKYPFLFFHRLVRINIDSWIARIATILTVILLIVLTMVDNHIPFFDGFLHAVGIYDSSDTWMLWISYSVSLFIIIPGLFWAFWGFFREESMCLRSQLKKAYQVKTGPSIQKQIQDMGS